MANQNKNAEQDNASKIENIKKVNSLLSASNSASFPVLAEEVKGLQNKLENVLFSHKSAISAREKQRREDTEREKQAALAKKAKPTPPPVVEAPPVATEVKQQDEPKAEIPIKKEEPAPKKPVEEVAKAAPVEKPAEKAEAPVEAVAPVKKETQTFIPSYIKGTYIPTPPPQRTQSSPWQNNKDGSRPPYNKDGNRPPYNKDGSRPPFNKDGSRPPYNNNRSQQGGQTRPPFGSPRPQGTAPRPMAGGAKPAMPITPAQGRTKAPDKKKEFNRPDEKKAMNKRTLIRKGFIQEDFGEERMGSRKLKSKKQQKNMGIMAPVKIEKAVITTENLTVKILSEKIGKTAQEIIKQLMLLGIMTTINSVVDFPTMELVANELGVELELKLDKTKEEIVEALHDEGDDDVDLVKRPPIITVMGHVDHGKTSLLDAIRKTTVAEGEAGGITQHIGAYSVSVKGERITFLDTPGHEAFTEMRARGAKVTDIAILIVAADDGVMPQTVEAINHAKAANVPILVAINKIDKPGANIDRVKQNLTEYELIPEEWGGDTLMVPISAKAGDGIEKLLETILFLSEYNNYRANPKRLAKASIIESRLDKNRGPVANVVVLNGTLSVGDYIVSGLTSGRVRAMTDDKGNSIKSAPPSTPVSVLGFTDVPPAGEQLFVVSDEKTAKQIVSERNVKIRNEQTNQGQKVTLDDVFNKISEGQIKDLNIVVKGDVQGSVEALSNSLKKLSNEEVKVNVVHGGVGAVNKSDLMLADVSNAIIVGFNVRPDAETRTLAESTGIDIRLYSIIYEAIDDIEAAMKGLIAPKFKESIVGRAQVRNIIKISNVGAVAGSYVLSGKIVRNAKVRIFRKDVVVFEGEIAGLRRFKDDVKEVASGYECGITIENYSAFEENDEIEAYVSEQIKI